MIRLRWPRSLQRVYSGSPALRASYRPRLEILEDRTVLSGRNNLPEFEHSGNRDILVETTRADLASSVVLEVKTDRHAEGTETPDSVTGDGGDSGGGSQGGAPPAGFFYAEGPGYPLLPIALRPLFSGGDHGAQQEALTALSSPLSLVPVLPTAPSAAPAAAGAFRSAPDAASSGTTLFALASNTTPGTSTGAPVQSNVPPEAVPSIAGFAIPPSVTPTLSATPTSNAAPAPLNSTPAPAVTPVTAVPVVVAPLTAGSAALPLAVASVALAPPSTPTTAPPAAIPAPPAATDTPTIVATPTASEAFRFVQASLVAGEATATPVVTGIARSATPTATAPSDLLAPAPRPVAPPVSAPSASAAVRILGANVVVDESEVSEQVLPIPVQGGTGSAQPESADETGMPAAGAPASVAMTDPAVALSDAVFETEPTEVARSDALWICGAVAVLGSMLFALSLRFVTARSVKESQGEPALPIKP